MKPMQQKYVTITAYAKIPVYKTVKYDEDMDLEEELRDDLNDLLYTSIIEKEDEVEFEDIDIVEEY